MNRAKIISAMILLVVTLGGVAEAQQSLTTPPILGGVGNVDCAIVNIAARPLDVTTVFFDNAGKSLGSGVQTISPGAVGGVSFGSQDGYCRWFIANGRKGEVRATGRVIHFDDFTVDLYPGQ